MSEFNIVAVANEVPVKGATFTTDGRLRTDTNVELTVDTVEVTDVSIASDGNKMKVDANGAIQVVLNHSLNSDHDEIAVGKILKSGVQTLKFTKNELTKEFDLTGFNKLMIQFSSTGNWKLSVKGSLVTNGQFVDVYSNDKKLEIDITNNSRIVTLSDIPEFIKFEVSTTDTSKPLDFKFQGVN